MTETDQAVRSPSQIRQQLKQVLYRHLQRILRANYRKAPETCCYNRLEVVAGTGARVGVCRWDGTNREDVKASPRGKVCDARVFGCQAMATSCSWWRPLREKTALKTEFRGLIASGDRGRIAASYPDVAALMWVLDGVDITSAVSEVEEMGDE